MAHTGGSSSVKSMPIMSHIRELQLRFVLSAVILLIGASLAYAFRDQVIHILLQPLAGQQLVYLTPGGGFSFILLVSIYAGLALAAPIAIHQLYCFVRPALSKRVQRHSAFILISSIILLIGGVAFGYFLAIPGALNFLQEFAGTYVEPNLTAESYLNFIVAYTLGLGLVFQLPLLLLLIHWIKPIPPKKLFSSERWVIVLAFIIAAIITPTPDPLNQTIIALPVIVIYQLGVIGVLVSIYREKQRAKKATVVTSKRTPAPAIIVPQKTPAVSQKVPAVAPVAQVLQPAAAKTHRPRSIDGFSARSAQRPIRPPQRQHTPPQARTVLVNERQSRGVSLDGIVKTAQPNKITP